MAKDLKQLIIDGVDVKDCKRRIGKDNYCRYYKRPCAENNYNCIWKKYLRKEQEYEELRKYHNKCCEENAKKLEEWLEKYNQVSRDFYNGKYCNKENCNLLKTKEQECERLKNKLNPKLKNAHCTYFEGQTGLCKAKEFTRCNPVGCKLYTIDELSTIVDLQQQLDQLKEFQKLLEEQMKFNKSELELSLSSEIKRSEFLIKEFKKVDKQRDNWREQAEKYSQTLAEIKEIAEKEVNNRMLFADKESFCDFNKILKKISEGLNDD